MSTYTSQNHHREHTGCVAAARVYMSLNNKCTCAPVCSVDRPRRWCNCLCQAVQAQRVQCGLLNSCTNTQTHAQNNTHTLDRLMQALLSCSVAPAALVKSTEWCIGPQFFATFSQMKLTNDIIHQFNCRHFSRGSLPPPLSPSTSHHCGWCQLFIFYQGWILSSRRNTNGRPDFGEMFAIGVRHIAAACQSDPTCC